MKLRLYQAKAIESVVTYALKNPNGRLLLVCPPGSGKTLITATVLRVLANQNHLNGLVIAHRREMVNHHYDHLVACGVPSETLGVMMGSDKRQNSSASIQIASIDTLNRREKPVAHVVVSDEAHRDASRSRRKIRSLYPNAFRLGVTATPTRLDGKGLLEDFDEMIVVSSISELVAGGFLSVPKTFTVPPHLLPDLGGVRTLAGEYEPKGLEKAVNRKALVGSIVDHWVIRAKKRRTVIFAANVEHSKHIAERFKANGVASGHLDQGTSLAERERLLRDLESGKLLVISCVNILSEGWDCPSCKCVVQARPTLSLNLHIQQTGRCMRPWRHVSPLILDHAGNMTRHGLPQMDREWSLLLEKKGRTGDAPTKTCPICLAVVPAGAHACPECETLFPQPSAVLEELPGELVSFELTGKERKAEWERILQFSERKGFPETWAKHVFEMKYGNTST